MKTANEFRGAYTVMVTPFKDDNSGIDEKALRRFIDWQIAEGVPGLMPLGSTGEFLAVDDAERTSLVTWTIDHVAGRVPVIVGTANHRTEVAIRYSQEAEALGADGVMIIPPYYYKPSDEEIYTYYARIDEKISIPIMLYNNPFNNRVDMSAEFVARLWRELGNVKYIKESSGVTERTYEVRRLTGDGMIVFGGWRPLEAYRIGALSENQVRRLLGFESRFEVHALLKEHRVPLRYTEADVESDLAAHRELAVLRRR